ncbi:MAG: serine/threonine-protein kinase [Pirellulaceae bacterium]
MSNPEEKQPETQKGAVGPQTDELFSGSIVSAGLEAAFGPDSHASRPRNQYEPGSMIADRYRLIEAIGEGGMGTVWYAEQLSPVKRKVAIKLIKAGLDSQSVLTRFEAERQALALMDHPNIAKVFDGGVTEFGQPFFVMELVKGTSITTWCDQNKIGPRERLELLIPVCQAIHHAHQKGIIHRDIKPSNVMVALFDGKPVPKVIDFGVAKAFGATLTEMSLHTAFGAVVGTAEYMSPEQAELNNVDIDTRSDVYSLGVLMYELLAGSTPFPRAELAERGWHEALRVIRDVDPPLPSLRLSTSKMRASIAAQRGIEPGELGKLLKSELDWVIMKSLEKDRARRYETAFGLAQDIERFLQNEPVAACPPSAGYKFRKFVRRNRASAIAASLILIALVAGLVGTSWQAIRATRAERAATGERDAKDLARLEALASAERARDAAESERKAKEEEALQRKKAEISAKQAAEEAAVAKAVNEFLQQDLLGLVGAEAQLEARMEPDPDLKLATLLERALANVDRRFADQPRVRRELQKTLAGAFSRIGRYEEAARLWKKLYEDNESRLGTEHPDTLISLGNLGLMYLNLADHAKAELPLTQSLDGLRSVLGTEHPDTVRSMGLLGMLYQDLARYREAETLLTQCLEKTQLAMGAEHLDTGKAMGNLAGLYQDRAQFERAEPLLAKSLDIHRLVLGAEHPETVNAMNNLAGLYTDQARYGEAEPLLTQCLEIQTRVLGPEHPRTLVATENLAVLFQYQGRIAEAEPLRTRCLDTRRRVLGPEHPDTLISMQNLVSLYGYQGNYAEAESINIQCLEISRRVLGPEHPRTLISINSLARLNENQGRFAEAEALYSQCLEITRRVQGPEHPDTLLLMTNLASTYQSLNRFAEAEQLFTQSLESCRLVLGPEHPDTLRAMNNLGSLFWKLEKFDRSIPLFEEILRIRKDTVGMDHPDTYFTMGNLGVNYRDGGRLADSLPLLEEAFHASRKYPELAWLWQPLANAWLKAGKFAEAATLAKKRLELARAELPGSSLELATELEPVGATLLKAQDWNGAEEVLRECLTMQDDLAPDEWQTFHIRSLLGGALLGQKKFDESEPLLLAGYEGLKARVAKAPDDGMGLSQAIERLVQLYTEWEKPDQAAAWQQKLDERKNRGQ